MSLLEFLNEDEERGPILIATHEYADGDGLGSALALYAFLKKLGYDVHVACKDKLPDRLDFLPYSDKLIQLPNNNFYNSIIIVDCTSLEDLGTKVKGLRIMRIDHHQEGSFYSRHDYVVPSAAATGVIVYDIISKIRESAIDSGIATCLYTAIVSDTGFFRYQNTDYVALDIAGKLVKKGARPDYIYSMINERRPSLYLQVVKDIIQGTRVYYEGAIAGIIINKQMYLDMYKAMINIDECLSYARSLNNVKIVFAIVASTDQKYTVFVRSKADINVLGIARQYNGKGHTNSVSFKVIGMDIEELVSQLLLRLKSYV